MSTAVFSNCTEISSLMVREVVLHRSAISSESGHAQMLSYGNISQCRAFLTMLSSKMEFLKFYAGHASCCTLNYYFMSFS